MERERNLWGKGHNSCRRSGDFRKQDYYTQQQLAKAAGKSVEEIARELGVRDKLGKLSGDQLAKANKLVDSGVDISNLSDEELKRRTGLDDDAIADLRKVLESEFEE